MRISTKPRYAVRILAEIALASRAGENTLSGKTIAERQNITEGYLEQLMIPLKRAGLVGAERGCSGGYKLLRSEEDVNVLELIELFEGAVTLSECSKQCGDTEWTSGCPTRPVWERLAAVFRREAERITLKMIVDDYELKTKQRKSERQQ